MGEITTRKLSNNSLEAIKQHIAKKTEILKKNVDLDNIEEIGTLLDAYKNIRVMRWSEENTDKKKG